jgi:hypothetical protein
MIGSDLLEKAPVLNKIWDTVNRAALKTFGRNGVKAVRKFGFDGLSEKVFEEYVEKPLGQALGLEDNEYAYFNFLRSLGMSSDEFLQIIGAVVAIQGGISHTTASLMNMLKKRNAPDKKIKQILTPLSENEKKTNPE